MNTPSRDTPNGDLDMFGFRLEQGVARAATDKAEGLEVLSRIPGIDPVLAVVDGQQDSIPASGWLINSHVSPGYGGVVIVHRYVDGGLVISSIDDGRDRYGMAQVRFDRYGGEHVVAYENPAFPFKDIEPVNRMSPASNTGLMFDRTEIVELEGGGRILDQKAPIAIERFYSGIVARWTDLSVSAQAPWIEHNRVTADLEEVKQILAQLGLAMSMSVRETEQMVSVVEDKINPAIETVAMPEETRRARGRVVKWLAGLAGRARR